MEDRSCQGATYEIRMVSCLDGKQTTVSGGWILTVLVVVATQAIANVVKSSFGPSGLDKMMVDDIGVRNTAECMIYCNPDELTIS